MKYIDNWTQSKQESDSGDVFHPHFFMMFFSTKYSYLKDNSLVVNPIFLFSRKIHVINDIIRYNKMRERF